MVHAIERLKAINAEQAQRELALRQDNAATLSSQHKQLTDAYYKVLHTVLSIDLYGNATRSKKVKDILPEIDVLLEDQNLPQVVRNLLLLLREEGSSYGPNV
jgi:hypothetical protein